MALGGLAPLPLRLGGSAEEGIKPDQWNRAALDVSCASDGTPLAVAVADGATVTGCRARGGASTLQVAVSVVTANIRRFTLPASFLVEESGLYKSQQVTFAIAHECGVGAASVAVTGNVVDVTTASGSSIVAVVVYGTTGKNWAGEYGGDPDKMASWTEGDVPYAWQWYQEIIGAMGSAYDNSPGSFVTMERRAQARMFAYVQRMAELISCQQNPAQADALLGRWATIMSLPVGQADWQIRRKAAARFALFSGALGSQLEAAVRTLLGDAFVGFVRYPGTLDAPPDPTYWPEGNPGLPHLDIGGGTWTTRRSVLVVDVADTPGFLIAERADQITRDLAEVLDGALPAVVSWEWSVGATAGGGFEVDVSEIGVDAL
jgi:hypothetical protein